jgi:sarcosine oxidase subunit beta
LEQELDADLHYRQGGNLLLATNELEAEQLKSFVIEQHQMGFTDVEWLDAQETHERVAHLRPHIVASSYSPADGQADPRLTVQAFVHAAQRLGAVFWFRTNVLSLLVEGGKVGGVKTADSSVEAGHVILAAGAWSDDLAAQVGLRLPIRTCAFQMLLSTPAQPALLAPVLSPLHRTLSLKQLKGGSFLIGGGWPGDPTPDRTSYTLRPDSIQGNWAIACEIFPLLHRQQILDQWCGLEAQSIDTIPFVGQIRGLDGLTLATGFSGHGFALAPAIGRLVTEQIQRRLTPELDTLSPQRIYTSDPKLVERFLDPSHPVGEIL